LKSDEIMGMFRVFLSRGEGKPVVAKVKHTYQFDVLTKKGGPVAKTYFIDLKNGAGSLSEGKGDKPDASFTMVDDDFYALC